MQKDHAVALARLTVRKPVALSTFTFARTRVFRTPIAVISFFSFSFTHRVSRCVLVTLLLLNFQIALDSEREKLESTIEQLRAAAGDDEDVFFRNVKI
jgi:hypothetical protein